MQTIDELIHDVPQVGRLEWIGTSSARRSEITPQTSANASTQVGLEVDYHCPKPDADRQVTLIQSEHLPVVAQLLGKDAVDPAQLRRNLVISGINLHGLRKSQFRIGEVQFEGTGSCPPCSRMNETLGKGGYHAMLGHGGITARVLQSGTLHLGDTVSLIEKSK